MQFDLETTGLDAERDRIFMIAVRYQSGVTETLEADCEGDLGESALVRKLVTKVKAADPDVIENQNLHGLDLPFLARRAQLLGMPLALGRIGPPGLCVRAARRGHAEDQDGRRVWAVAPDRELIDTLDAVLRYDFAARELPDHGLETVARHLGIAGPDREQIRGDKVYAVYRRDPDRVRRYATADVNEVAAVARMLGGAAFALSQIAPQGDMSGSPMPERPPVLSIRCLYARICVREWHCRHTSLGTEHLTRGPRSTFSPPEWRTGL